MSMPAHTVFHQSLTDESCFDQSCLADSSVKNIKECVTPALKQTLENRFTAAVITDDGSEICITEEMIQQACSEFDEDFPTPYVTNSLQSKG